MAGQAITGSNQEVIENSVRLFSSFLSSEWTRKRPPNKFRESIKATRSSSSDDTSRIFLDRGGFKAWLAHLLASTGEVHFSGRQAQRKLIAEVDKLPVEERAEIAQRVGASYTHPSAEGPIRSMEQQTMNTQTVAGASKRRREYSLDQTVTTC